MSLADDTGHDSNNDRGRRWHEVRPLPGRGSDLMGFNSTLWMGLAWVILLLALVFSIPWWS